MLVESNPVSVQIFTKLSPLDLSLSHSSDESFGSASFSISGRK